MRFNTKTVVAPIEILANDHYVAVPTSLESFSALAVDRVVKAGTIIPANDATAMGVVLYDVNLDENPNGAVVIHGFIKTSKLPAEPTTEAEAALKQICFIPEM